ncbi:MAG: tetratricopeptide repeat protein [Bdellovibrionales bacterium]
MKLNAIIFVLTLIVPSIASAGLKESWYMYRGRENMKIKNYKAAIEAYEKAVELNPKNREAARDLGHAYEKQGLVDKAVGQYDAYLSQWSDDHDVALRQARLLKWSRYSYRQQDAIKYYQMSLRHRNDSQVRLEYADVLASKKETSSRAIPEYKSILRSNPRNAGAHRGLAKAYAWNGNQDQSLYHSRLAREYGDDSQDIKRLQSSLERDRRPRVGGEAQILHQVSSEEFDLSGIRVGGLGEYHLTPFVTGRIRGGVESFWNANDSKSGGYLGGGFEYRLSPESSWLGSLTYHGLSDDGIEAEVAFQTAEDSGSQWEFGIRRELIYDSYLSLVGKQDFAGRKLGSARKTVAYTEYARSWRHMETKLVPYLGFVSAQSVSQNLVFGGDADIVYPLSDAKWFLISHTGFISFERDHSGFQIQDAEPLAGGYFSPSTFFVQDFLVRYQHGETEEHKWSLAAGPSFQHVSGTSSDGVKWGGRFESSYLRRLTNGMYLHLSGDLRRVADVYAQLRAMAWLTYVF